MKTGTLILKPISFKSDDFTYDEKDVSKIELLKELTTKQYGAIIKAHTNENGNAELILVKTDS